MPLSASFTLIPKNRYFYFQWSHLCFQLRQRRIRFVENYVATDILYESTSISITHHQEHLKQYPPIWQIKKINETDLVLDHILIYEIKILLYRQRKAIDQNRKILNDWEWEYEWEDSHWIRVFISLSLSAFHLFPSLLDHFWLYVFI